MTLKELIAYIKEIEPRADRPVVVAVSGFCGSGKSTLASVLATDLPGAEVVSIDDFITGLKHERSKDWHTFDRERLRKEILEPARSGKLITYRQYQSGIKADHKAGTQRTIHASSYLIIEGCSVIHPSLTKYYDYSVWIDCSEETARRRAEVRNESQGRKDHRLWEEVWGPNDRDYFKSFQPDRLADATVAF